MIQVGDKVKKTLRIYDPHRDPPESKTTVEATVIYVHPERRFITLRYDLPGGSYCESEPLDKIT